jgi:CRISPR-associated endoribonuclease Cas6
MTYTPQHTHPEPDNPNTEDLQAADYGALVMRLQVSAETLTGLDRKAGRISDFMGNAVHQALHGVITDLTAAALHDPKIAWQPFATSTLFRWQLDMPLYGRIQQGDRGWVRFVGLHPYMLRELERFRRGNPRQIEIDRVWWKITGCGWGDHLYAGSCSAAQRWRHHHELPEPRLIRLRFLTPTYFRSRNIEPYLAPEPRLVFAEGLMRRWGSFYPNQPPPTDFTAFAERYIHLRECRGYATSSIMLKGVVLRGFTGDVVYAVARPLQADAWFEACARFAGLLAEYATYAGVGKKTTMGLGMVDRLRIVRSGSA